jgi:hypothetical protein
MEGMYSAVLQIVISVDANGKPTRATVLNDPGYGFGRQIRRCVMQITYPPPKNAWGKPVAGTMPTLQFRFKM